MIVLSGGTGTPKLLTGLREIMDPPDLAVVVNTAEDLWVSGNLVSPDIDSVLYALAGTADEARWWGIRDDTFHTAEFLRRLGHSEMLLLGDCDRAVHIFRSELLRRKRSLSYATEALGRALGIRQRVVPMTDDPVATMIATPEGEMHFQDFWVGRKGLPEVLSLGFHGLDRARPSQGFLDLLKKEETVLMGPSNPVTSIGPILNLPGVRQSLRGKRLVAVSPLVGDRPVGGPAAKLMKAMGIQASDEGVASLLGDLDVFVVDDGSSYSGRCKRLDTLMRSREDSLRLARSIVELI